MRARAVVAVSSADEHVITLRVRHHIDNLCRDQVLTMFGPIHVDVGVRIRGQQIVGAEKDADRPMGSLAIRQPQPRIDGLRPEDAASALRAPPSP